MQKLEALHDSHNDFYRSPFGAVPCNTGITLRLKITTTEDIHQTLLWLKEEKKEPKCMRMDLVKQTGDERLYQIAIEAAPNPMLLWYYFIIDCHHITYYYGNNNKSFGGEGEMQLQIPPAYQITVYRKDTYVPEWFQEAIMYQIFPDRFFNGTDDGKVLSPKPNSFIYGNWQDSPVYLKENATGRILRWEFFGGNLMGIIKKLPYLKELGINVLYLNPIFESPSNHRYDTADYMKIDSMLGNNQIFKALCREAKKNGISIILDGVFSHTGSDSIYFNRENTYDETGAYQSKASLYYSWYRFEEFPNKYGAWWGIDTMPNVNEMEKSYQNFVFGNEDSVIKYWMKMGVMGWRLDVADELPSIFIKELRKAMKEVTPHSILIGEVWEDASNKISYGERREYLLGEELDSVMNYPFRKILLDFFLEKEDAAYTHHALMSLHENYPTCYFYSMMNLIGSHDVPRILTLLGASLEEDALTQEEKEKFLLKGNKKELAVARLKLLTLLQMTFPGVPSIYYGDEAGVEGHGDPLNRRTYPWGKQNMELLNWYKKIIRLRHRYEVLKKGKWKGVYANGDIYGFVREKEDGDAALILVNRSHRASHNVTIELGYIKKRILIDVLNDHKESLLENRKLQISLGPLEGRLYIGKR
ncbi:Glycosidase [Anaerovirgula multivorans]|uniref:Glycosidase n=1 Tax=Anaerovirgula multivorans TaxID=312168 RepID=A0A239K4I7_9FIRM|nr:glycoside hydrolase family 13 protein [Anaerovirgula multivorans]SNT13336.1 Glycosidase [Anaerovirgula multivorans]